MRSTHILLSCVLIIVCVAQNGNSNIVYSGAADAHNNGYAYDNGNERDDRFAQNRANQRFE